MINVVYEDNHIIVVVKPYNIPTQADESNDMDLLTMVKDYIKVKYQKPGNVFLGMVHRLDRPTGGLVVFARTSKAASRLSDQIRRQLMKKQYLAVVLDHGLKQSDTFVDYLLKNEETNIVKVHPDGKYSELSYEVIRRFDDYAEVLINLITGRSHQIRVQFATRNHPLYGDQKYNSLAIKNTQLALWAYTLSFIHPTTKELLTFKVEPSDKYPFKGG